MSTSQADLIDRARQFFSEYAWFIVRNIIGWLMILASPVLGMVVPGPGGLPIFIIGFALVTFPGKRRLTTRVLRGRRLQLEDKAYLWVAAFISIIVPGVAWWVIWVNYEERIREFIAQYAFKKGVYFFTALLAILLTWLVTRLSLKILNGLLRLLPRFRRRFRPWLKRQGLKLLPPRRRRSPEQTPDADEILEISSHHRRRLRDVWAGVRPWVRRIAAIGITVWIVAIMLRPLAEHWPEVRAHVAELAIGRYLFACLLFSIFLLCFRALSWRRVLKDFGYKLPYGSSTRIWSTSELARYLPGAIWQVVGRVYLARPYGVPGSIVSTSQILEVFIFLFANVLVAGACLLWFGQKMDPAARPWLMTALALVPTLALLLHPKIFYGAVNRILVRLGKPPIVKRLRGRHLVQLLFWMILGLLLQSLCVYLIVDPVLHFKKDWWWVMAGAYCLAWCAGFIAFWAPGGIGVRELVFVATMQVIMPAKVRERFSDPATLQGLLVLLGFLLRLWTVVGELILTAAAHLWDWKGALKRPDAPGRRPPEELESLDTSPPAPELSLASADSDARVPRSPNTPTAAIQPSTPTRTAT